MPSPSSLPSDPERSRSVSPGSAGLGRGALLDLARRHGITPRKSLGQHFLIDPNVARAIARDAGAGPGERFLEVGAGLGSLTVALAEAGSEVLAVEVDRRLVPALAEATEGFPVRIAVVDAVRADWPDLLGEGPWRMASNLPYNVAVPALMGLLEGAPNVDPLVVMVQREVGERLVSGPADPSYGAVSLRVAYRAKVRTLRRVGPSVFWPEPNIDSVVLRLDRRPPPVAVPRDRLFRLIDEGFRQRRKTLASALVRLGHPRAEAETALERASLDPKVRAEALGLEDFARLADALDG
jgi:16S rRNA (adenine1518-N6/adenine1519-N6)-dimethyltransferase